MKSKHLISVLLAFLMLFSSLSTAFAAENTAIPTEQAATTQKNEQIATQPVTDPDWPLDIPIETTGQIFYVSYQYLCNESDSLGTGNKDVADNEDSGVWIWTGTITVETNYSDNTVAPVLN